MIGNKNMKTIELFSGTKSFSKVAKELGHETFTIDNDQKLEPDKVASIMDIEIPLGIDMLWSSPPLSVLFGSCYRKKLE